MTTGEAKPNMTSWNFSLSVIWVRRVVIKV